MGKTPEKGKVCKSCVFHDQAKKKAKMVKFKGIKDPVLFRPCVNPQIDGVNRKTHDAETKVLVMSRAKHPLYTHNKWGCRLYAPESF